MKSLVVILLVVLLSTACGNPPTATPPRGANINPGPTLPTPPALIPPEETSAWTNRWISFDEDCTNPRNNCTSRGQFHGDNFVLSVELRKNGTFGGRVSDSQENREISGPDDPLVKKYQSQFQKLANEDYRYGPFGQ